MNILPAMKKWRLVLVGAWVAVGLASCSGGGGGASSGAMGDLAEDEPAEGGISEVPNPNAGMAAISGTPLGRLQRGHEVYMLKCGECHDYMLPQRIDQYRWEQKLPKMINHAGLGAAEEKAVLEYVIAVRKVKG